MSYDLHQRLAVLLVCAGCQKPYYVTTPQGWTRCAWCR